MAVLADLFYDYIDVGKEFIVATTIGKKGLVWIFLVSLGSRFVGQAIARRRLRQKVTRLKRDMADTVQALTRITVTQSSKKKRMSRSKPKNPTSNGFSVLSGFIPGIFVPDIKEDTKHGDEGFVSDNNIFRDEDDANVARDAGVELTPSSRARTLSKSSGGIKGMFSQGDHAYYDELDVDEDTSSKRKTRASGARRGSIVGNKSTRKSILWNPLAFMEKEEEENNEAILDLVDILNEAAKYDLAGDQRKPETRSSPAEMKRNTNDQTPSMNVEDEDDPDDWGDINLAPFEEESTTLNMFKEEDLFPELRKKQKDMTSLFKMQGYLGKLKPGANSRTFQRRYFVLTKDNLLIYYQSMADITKHVGASKGIINMRHVTKLTLKETQPSGIITFYENERLFTLQSYTLSEAVVWHKALNDALSSLTAFLDIESLGDKDLSQSATYRSVSTRLVPPASAPLRAMRRNSTLPSEMTQNNIDPVVSVVKRTRKGQLIMKGAFFWQDLFFSLTERGELVWYTSDPDVVNFPAAKKGYLLISDILSIDQQDEDPCCFDINLKGFTHELQGHSEQETREWIIDLMSWMQSAEPAVPKRLTTGTSNNIMLGTPSEEFSKIHGIDVESGSVTKAFGSRLTKKGWLNKKNAFYWQKRWFELVPPGELIWYVNEHDAVLGESRLKRDSIFISNILSVDLHENESLRLDVNIKGRVYELKAETTGEVLAWYTALHSWMNIFDDNHNMPERISSEHLSTTPRFLTRARSESGNENSMNSMSKSFRRTQRCMTTTAVPNSLGGFSGKKHFPTRNGVLQLSILFNTKHFDYWFVLAANGELSWYTSENEASDTSNQTGCIRMADVLDLEPSEAYPTRFAIVMEGVKYELEAKTKDDATNWITDLQAWLVSIDQDSAIPEGDKHDDQIEKESMTVVVTNVNVKKCGWMQKKNAVYWQTRWFELLNSGELNWYLTDKDAAAGISYRKGTLDMFTVTAVDKNFSVKSSFLIETSGRTYTLKASSDDDRNDWCDALTSFFVTSPELYAQVLTRRITRLENSFSNDAHLGTGHVRKGSVYSMDSRKNSLSSLPAFFSNAEDNNGTIVPFGEPPKVIGSVDTAVFSLPRPTRRCSSALLADSRARTALTASVDQNLVQPQRTKRASAIFSVAYSKVNEDNASAPRDRESTFSRPSVDIIIETDLQNIVRDCCKQGWLHKKGGIGNRAWQKRWFLLSRNCTSSSLYWFKDEIDKSMTTDRLNKSLKGQMRISEVLSVDQHSHDSKLFDINIKGRTYELQAFNIKDSLEWHNAIADAISVVSEGFRMSSRLSTLMSARQSMEEGICVAKKMADLNTILKQCDSEMMGYLQLRNNMNSNVWKDRWFVLGRPDVLSWDVLSGTSVGTIAISDMLSVDMSDSSKVGFEINIKGRAYEIRAQTPDEANKWCAMLLLRIEKNTLESLESVSKDSANSAIQKNILGYSYLSVRSRTDSARGSFSMSSFNKHTRCGLLSVKNESLEGREATERKLCLDTGSSIESEKEWLSCWCQLSSSTGIVFMPDGDIQNQKAIFMPAVKDIKRRIDDLSTLVITTHSEKILFRALDEFEANKWFISMNECFLECKSRMSRSQSEPTVDRTNHEGIFTGIEKRGYLLKTNMKSGLTGLKKNWFVLREPGMLLWYESEEEEHHGNMKGSLLLDSLDWIQEPPAGETQSSLTFCVHERVFDVYAFSHSEASDWFCAISSWVCTRNRFKIDYVKGDIMFTKTDEIRRVSAPKVSLTDTTMDDKVTTPLAVAAVDGTDNTIRIKEGGLLINFDVSNRLLLVQRWFVAMRSDNWRFSWYLNEVDAHNPSTPPEGSIEVASIDCVRQSIKNPCCFEIVTGSGSSAVSYRLECTTSDLVLEWCDALKVCMTDHSLHHNGKISDEAAKVDAGLVNDHGVKSEEFSETRRSRAGTIVLADTDDCADIDLDDLKGDTSEEGLVIEMKETDNLKYKSSEKSENTLMQHALSSNFKIFEPVDPSLKSETDLYTKLNDVDRRALEGTSGAARHSNASIGIAWKFISGVAATALLPSEDQAEVVGETVEDMEEADDGVEYDDCVDEEGTKFDDEDDEIFEPIGRSSISAVIKSLPSAWQLDVDNGDDDTEHSKEVVSDVAPTSDVAPHPMRAHSVSVNSTASFVNDVEQSIIRPRRTSDTANKAYLKIHTKVDDDEFVNNLKTHSYRDLNAEFWFTHRYYLLVVVCFVTLQVLYAIAEIVRSIDDYND